MNALRAQVEIRVLSPDPFDRTAVCGFDLRSDIIIYAYDVHDTCIWEASSDFVRLGPLKTSYDNDRGDTIIFRFNRDKEAELKGKVTVTVKVGKGTAAPSGSLEMTLIPKASNVQDVLWEAPVCEGLPTKLSVPADPNWATGYAPGKLHLNWEFLQAEDEQGDGYMPEDVEIKSLSDFEYSYDFPNPNYKGGAVSATFFTCERRDLRGQAKKKDLTPFIVKGLYTTEKIYPMKRKDDAEMGDAKDMWKADGGVDNPNKVICRDYPDKSLYIIGQIGSVYLGFGDLEVFEEMLNADDKTVYPENYYFYEWVFDPAEFAFDEERINMSGEGFGKGGLGKNRTVLKVLGGKEGATTNVHKVELIVTCPVCIERGGLAPEFTYKTTLELQRQDSISNFKDEAHPIDYSVTMDKDEICAEQELTLTLNMDEASDHNYDAYSNAKHFVLNPTKPDGNSAEWEQLDSPQEGVYKFRTAKTSWLPGKAGDTIKVHIYPANDCFDNGKKVGRNGQQYKVFVKNPPVMPVLIDPITKESYEPLYTESRWKQMGNSSEQETSWRFFACNYIAGQGTGWLDTNQRYGLQVRNDRLFNPNAGDNTPAFGLVDYDGMFMAQDSKPGKMVADFEKRSIDDPNVDLDSSWVRLRIDPDARKYFETMTEVKVGFYAYNQCGVGDTGIYYIKIIDTLPTQNIRSLNRPGGFDTLCEGMELDLYSDSYTYFTPADVSDPTERPYVVTDRVDYAWKVPDSWSLAEGGTLSDEELALTVGWGNGQVGLRIGNRCGYGKYLDTNIFAYPFVRVTVVGDSTPCQGDSVVYKFKKADLAEAYQWMFPHDWEIESQPPVEGFANIAVSGQASADAQDSISIGVRVGATTGDVYVVGQKTKVPGLKPINETEENYGCNYQFDTYKDHNRDSLAVRVKQWTSRPVIDGGFPTSTAVTSAPDPSAIPDTLCADELYRFQVEKGSEADDSVFFRWFFPDGWPTASYFSKDSDTVDFETPLADAKSKRMTIRVASSRYDCDATNRGDTAYIAVWLTDTVAVEGDFLDVHPANTTDGGRVNPTPCEGDTVYYTLNKRLQHKEAYCAVFDVRPIEATGDAAADWDALSASDWEILSEAPYHDTVKMVVGRDPMRLRAAMVSHCDTSSFKEDTIWPISKVIDAGLVEMDRPDMNLCEYEAVSFTFEPVAHATDYVFHYPWGDRTDTVRVADTAADRAAGRLTDDGFYKISFADTFAYDQGVVYLEAYNVCGVRPDNDELEIASVLRVPAVPVLAQVDFAAFVYDAAHVIGQDTVMDSLCRRVPVVLEAEPADVAEAAAAGWRFHYAWSLTVEDASVTAFEAYASDDWAAGAGVNARDSLWTLTKGADGLAVNYLWLTSRHETCQRFGDTLTVALRPTDTTALQGEDRIENYLYDKVAEAKNSEPTHIETKPCANTGGEVAYYLDLSALDATGQSYYFRWRRDSTEDFGNVYAPDTKTIAGGKFVLNNAPDDGDWTTLDTLKMTLPGDADTLEIQVVVQNRCEKAHLPGLTIQTAEAITESDVYAVVPVSDYICDEEKLTYKVVSVTGEGADADTTDGVARAGRYIWYAPWREKSDTTYGFKFTYDTMAYQPGTVYVVPYNGCGDGHRSDSVVITEADILQPPLRVQPVPSPDFASGYDPAAGVVVELVADSLCLRSDLVMAVTAGLALTPPDPDAPQDRLSYGWFTAYGKAEALTIPDAADSTQAVVNIPDFVDSAYIVYVAARRSVCQRFGDSLRIELFPMDTIRFINDPVEDDEPFNRFTVLTRDALQDGWPTAAVDEVSLSPCVGSTHTYGIKPDFHWSLTTTGAGTPETAAAKSGRRAKRASKAAIDENRLHFSWNGGQTGATDGRLDGTTSWKSLQPDQLPYVLDVEVGAAGDPLHLSVHAKNICGPSVSKPLTIEPQALIDVAEKPVFKPLAPLCEDDTIRVEVEPVAAATGYVWTASFRGGAKDTTADPQIAYAAYAVPDGTITVYGFNACGDGMMSDPLEIKPLLRIPDRPTATWFDGLKMSAAGDTVYDTLCVSGANLLCVQAAFEGEAASETEAVFYDWKMLPAYSDYAVLTPVSGTLADGPDSIYLTPRGMNAGEDLYLMVAARREDCRRWSDTLYIALHLTDVVSVGDLGSLRWYDPATDDRNPIALQLPFCPGTEVRIGVENENAAPAYRWQFPDPTWRFADAQGADTTAAVVRVVVGENPGVIRVSPMTDADNRRCTIEVEEGNALTSDPITLVAAFAKREFVTDGANAFDAAPCAGMRLTYEIKPLSPAEVADGKFKHYRWVFPQGWRVYDAGGALTETNAVESGAVQCSVLPDTAAGVVRVYAVSQCGDGDQSSVSQPVEASVQPKDTARLAIVADATVCKDSTLQIELQPLNTWTSGTGYGLEVTYLGSDAAVITPESPLTFDFPNAPDSSLVMVGWYSGDSVRLTFTPRHTAGCSVLPVVYALRADTIPAIDGRILGPERVCMEAEAAFKAEAYVEEGVSVAFRWEVPDEEGWEILQGGDSAEVLIKIGRYEETDELTKTIRCYPRALCGTAMPFEYTLTVNPPAVFNGTLAAFTHPEHLALTPADRPCIGSDLAFELTHPDAPAQVRYVWETPAGWQRTTTGTAKDSTAQAFFTASKAGADTLRVRYLEIGNPLSCGLSQPLGYALFIRDSAPKAHLTRPPYPCNTRSEVEFAVAPDAEVDSTAWTWPEAYDDGKAEVSTAEGSLITNNTLKLTEQTEGAGFAEAFALTVRTVNACGARDTLMEIRPVGEIPALPNGLLHISHYCPGDSAYAYADQLEVYAGTGTAYHWLPDERLTPLADSVIRENDEPSGTEQTAWMRFAGGTATDTAEIRFYARNDCNATDTALIRTAAHTYAILARPETDTAVYGQSGVGLSVVATQYGTPADYTYEWQPADRVRLSDPEAPDAPGTTFATKELYNRYEYFHVVSTERIDTMTPFYFGRSACRATDTVMIFVENTFAMATAAADTACMGDMFAMSARPHGGNTQRYYFDWYRLTADSVYELLADAGHGEILSMPIDAPLIRLMVVGRDTTLIYAETPDEPENPEEPTEPDVPDEPDPDDPDNPENPDDPDNPEEPTVPDVPAGDPLYVFSQVDTQYVEVQAFSVNGRWILPGRDEIQVPFGTKVRLSAEATGGGRQYVYDWTPADMLERHDSTAAAVSTLRLYEDCDAGLTIRDLVTGCSDTLRVRINLSDEIGDIPNAFSPNGDGINDVFMKGTDLVIYDRFGQELFRSVQQEGWDGTFKGATVKPGDYLFVVTIRKNGQEYVKKGTVTVFTK